MPLEWRQNLTRNKSKQKTQRKLFFKVSNNEQQQCRVLSDCMESYTKLFEII